MKRFVAIGLGIACVIAVAAPAGASDKSTAKQLVLTKADVGSGFVAQKAADNSATFGKVAECVGKPNDRKVSARVQGPELINEADKIDIHSNAVIVKTAAGAKADRAVVADDKFPDCLGQIAEDQVGGDASVTAQRVQVKKYGDYSTAVLATLEGTSDGKPVTITFVEVLVMKGRAELSAEFATDGTTPFDQTEGEKILDKLEARLNKAKV